LESSGWNDEPTEKILRAADKTPVAEVATKHGLSELTIDVLRRRFGVMGADELKRLKKLIAERLPERQGLARPARTADAACRLLCVRARVPLRRQALSSDRPWPEPERRRRRRALLLAKNRRRLAIVVGLILGTNAIAAVILWFG